MYQLDIIVGCRRCIVWVSRYHYNIMSDGLIGDPTVVGDFSLRFVKHVLSVTEASCKIP